MVLPVIAAAGARVAGTAAARAGASTIARTGAQTAARGASSTVRRGVTSEGRNIVRTRRNPGTVASVNQTNSNPNVTRTRNSANGQVNNGRVVTASQDSEDEYDEDVENYGNASAPKDVKYRIGYFTALILLIIAALFDVSELILDVAGTFLAGVGVVLGYIKDAISFLFFPLVFWALGAPFWKGRKAKKKVIAMITGLLISLLPWIGALLPETIISVFVTIYFTRAEDRNADPVDSLNKDIVRAKRTAQRIQRISSRFRR